MKQKTDYEIIQEAIKKSKPIVFTKEGKYINIETGEDVTDEIMKYAIKIDKKDNCNHNWVCMVDNKNDVYCSKCGKWA